MSNKLFLLTASAFLIFSLALGSCKSTASTPTNAVTTTTTTASLTTTKIISPTSVTTQVPTATTIPAVQPQYGGTLNIPTINDPAYWDPSYSNISIWVLKFIYEPLVMGNWAADRTKNPDIFKAYGAFPISEAKGCLAESWETPDLGTIVFRIRKGINFQNKLPVLGREVTANDVVYCFNRLLGIGSGFSTPNPTVKGTNITRITSVTAPDKYTVVVKYNPSAAFLASILGMTDVDSIYAQEAVQAIGGLDNWKNAVGTGPFVIDSFVPGSSIALVKNPNYWGYDELNPHNKLPYVDMVQILNIPDKATVLTALRTRKLDLIGPDLMCKLDNEQSLNLQKTNPEIKIFTRPAMAFAVQLMVQKKPFTDLKVRTALQMAVNLPELAQTFFKGAADTEPYPIAGKMMTDYVTPFNQWPEALQNEYTYNPTKAKQLLAEAGYPSGFTTSITCDAFTADLAQIVKGYWEAIGVKTDVLAVDYNTWGARLVTHTAETIMIYWGSINGAPLGAFIFYRTGSSSDFGAISDPVFDKYFDDIQAATDLTQMYALGREANMYANTQHWIVALNAPLSQVAVQPWIGGYQGEEGLGSTNFGAIIARTWNDLIVKKNMGIRP